MSIGIIVASSKEAKPFFDIFGQPNTTTSGKTGGFEVSEWWFYCARNIYLVVSGVGEIAAAAATQYLIDRYRVEGIINYGVVGGTREDLTETEYGIVEKVVHYDFDISLEPGYRVGQYPGHDDVFIRPVASAIPNHLTEHLPKLICASADKFVAAGEPKRNLRREFGADICEMEAAGILITCNRNNVPCTIIKAVSDGVDKDADAFDKYLYDASKNCVLSIAKALQGSH